MTISPVPVLFWGAFFLLLTLCGEIHLHGAKGLIASAIGAALLVVITRPWWRRGYRKVTRTKDSFRDHTLGNRATRRAQEKRHRAR